MSDTSVELQQPAPAAAAADSSAADSAAGPQADAAAPAPSATEAPTRRSAAPVMPAFGLPHVSSSEIRAELRRREGRIEKLLAERAALVAEMEQIEATLAALRED
jgi:hypothetical protein